MQPDPRFHITCPDVLERLFDAPSESAIAKEIDHIDANYQALIQVSPFVVLATCGRDGLDCSPRGDKPGFVTVLNQKTLVIPDRRGNHRLDSLHNLLSDSRVALLFLIPGLGEMLRVNGHAIINADPTFLASFAVNGTAPKVALIVTVGTAYFQCARAVVRADLWNMAAHVNRAPLSTAGKILADITAQRIDGTQYDTELPDRIKSTLY